MTNKILILRGLRRPIRLDVSNSDCCNGALCCQIGKMLADQQQAFQRENKSGSDISYQEVWGILKEARQKAYRFMPVQQLMGLRDFIARDQFARDFLNNHQIVQQMHQVNICRTGFYYRMRLSLPRTDV